MSEREFLSIETKQGIVDDLSRWIGEFNEDTTCRVVRSRGANDLLIVAQKVGPETIIIQLEVKKVDMV